MRVHNPQKFVDKRNKTESRYEREVLYLRKRAGEVLSYQFEGLRLKLANNTTYTPDYIVEVKASDDSCYIECHEVKGYWRDDARIKIKIAAEKYQWIKFIAVTWDRKKGWQYEEFKPSVLS